MATTVANLLGLLDGLPPGAWVAVSERDNIVVAYGPDLQEVMREAKSNGEGHPLLTRIPDRALTMFY